MRLKYCISFFVLLFCGTVCSHARTETVIFRKGERHFNKITADRARIKIFYGETNLVSADFANPEILKYLIIYVQENTLYIKENTGSIPQNKSIFIEMLGTINVFTSELKELTSGGLSNVTIVDAFDNVEKITADGLSKLYVTKKVNTPHIDITITGAGKCRCANIESNDIVLIVSGIGSAKIKGICKKLTASIEGNCICNTKNLNAKNVYVCNKSINNVYVWAIQTLTAETFTLGNIYYKGNPKNVIFNEYSIGKVKKTI